MTEDLQNRVKDYVKQLEFAPMLDNSEPTNSTQNIADSIYSLITNSKFRRTKVDEVSEADIKRKIQNAIESNLPIEYSIPFGGYKNYRMPTFPEAEWAEVFNIRFMIRYLLPIASAYKQGVILTYSYNSQIMHRVSNMPLAKQKAYEDSITNLINYFNEQCPENLILKTQKINDLYASKDDWQNEWNENYERNKREWNSLYDLQLREKKVKSARHNLILDGERNLVHLSTEELETEYLNAAMMCDAIDCLSKRREFNKFSHRIQVVYVRGPKPAIHLGVCEGSTRDFWVGLAVMEIREDKILPKILSFEQFEYLKSSIQMLEVENKFSTISKNFDKVLILNN
ncbi:MAG: hypothetical protein IPG01_14425 [Chitinophagaceae bacterium]|nr:hypothetical protein [Chitinophagaceae bacterium]